MDIAKGIVPPMITPLLDDDRLDHEGLEMLIEHLISGGVHGLFILGTTGEGPSLGYSLRIELIERVCSQVEGRVPVLVGITDASFRESVNIANKSEELGAEAAVMAPPFYFPVSKSELYDYTDDLLREVQLPVYLYNQPSLTKVNFDLDVVPDLLDRPEVVGFKDSSGDMIYFQKLKTLTEKHGIPLLCGPEELLVESLVMGGDGGVPGGANVFPSLYVNIYDSVLSGDIKEALRLNKIVLGMSHSVYSDSNYGASGVINGIKCALSHLNICNDHMARPLHGISPERAKQVRKFIDSQEISS